MRNLYSFSWSVNKYLSGDLFKEQFQTQGMHKAIKTHIGSCPRKLNRGNKHRAISALKSAMKKVHSTKSPYKSRPQKVIVDVRSGE